MLIYVCYSNHSRFYFSSFAIRIFLLLSIACGEHFKIIISQIMCGIKKTVPWNIWGGPCQVAMQHGLMATIAFKRIFFFACNCKFFETQPLVIILNTFVYYLHLFHLFWMHSNCAANKHIHHKKKIKKRCFSVVFSMRFFPITHIIIFHTVQLFVRHFVYHRRIM